MFDEDLLEEARAERMGFRHRHLCKVCGDSFECIDEEFFHIVDHGCDEKEE